MGMLWSKLYLMMAAFPSLHMSTGSYRFTSLKNKKLVGQANHLVMCSWKILRFFRVFRTQDCRPHGKTRWQGCHEGFFEASSEKARGRKKPQTSHHGPRWIFWKNWKLLPNTTNDACFIINYTSFDLSSRGSCVNMFQNVLNQMRHLRNLSPTWNVQAIFFIHLHTNI